MSKFLKKFGGFSLGPIIGAFLGFITVPLVTYFISADEFGRASMFSMAQSTMSILMYMGLDQAYVREFNQARLENKKDELLVNAMFLPVFMAMLIGVLIFVFPSFVSQILFDNRNEIFISRSLAVMLPFMIFENFGLLKIRMEEKGTLYSFFTILLKLLTLAFTVLLFVAYEKSFRSVIFASVISEILTSCFVIFTSLRKTNLLHSKLDKALIKRMLYFGIPLMPAAIIGWLLTSMDKVMLRTLCNYSELGVYSAAFKIVNVLGIIQSCFTLFWPPVAYRWHEEKKDNKYFSAVNDIVAVVMVIMCMLILLCKDIVAVILGKNFAQSIYIFPFIMLYPIMYTMSETTCLGISFSRKTGYNIIVTAISGTLNVILNYLLIPSLGGKGAAIATGLSYIAFFWGRTLFSRRLWFKFPIKKYAIYMFVIIINCFVHTFCTNWLPYAVSAVTVCVLLPTLLKTVKEGRYLFEA